MRGLNRTLLVGHLGRDPELRTSSRTGNAWCTFTLATGRSRRAGDGWTEVTDWHRVNVFGTQAELCHRYLSKGRLVAVEGSTVHDTWTDEAGHKHTSTLVMADRVTFLDSSGRAVEVGEGEGPAPAVAQAK
jgi:single-strand DNA-binding protein